MILSMKLRFQGCWNFPIYTARFTIRHSSYQKRDRGQCIGDAKHPQVCAYLNNMCVPQSHLSVQHFGSSCPVRVCN